MAENDSLSPGEAFNILDLVGILRRGWLLILVVTVGVTGAMAFYAASIEPVYRAEVLVAYSGGSESNSGLSALAGQFGGLLPLAGVNVGGGERSEAIATLTSRALTQMYVSQNNLMPVLFKRRWNSATKTFSPDSKGRTPTLWDANKLFVKKIRSLSDDKKSGLILLGIEWTDPMLCAKWANDLVALTNATLKSQAIAASNANVAYLNSQLEKTSVVELRVAMYRLIENEIKKAMVAQGSEEYAFKVIDPATVPQEKVRPNKAVILSFSFILSLVISSFLVLVRHALRSASK